VNERLTKNPMKVSPLSSALLLFAFAANCGAQAEAGQEAPPPESRFDCRYSIAAIEDATFYSDLQVPAPEYLNQVLLEPKATLKYRKRWTLASSMIGLVSTYGDSHAQVRVKETFAGLSAGDFDFMVGRRIVRWGTGYAFTAAGVLDPPRVPTDPTDRLNVHQGRDMVKGDWVHGKHAFSLAWSSTALSSANLPNLRDTMAFRYNVLVHGFDTALIAGDDRGGDAFGAVTFTRVFGQAWEMHGEASWREQGAVLLGGKYTTTSGITFIGEFFAPPNIPYYRDTAVSPLAGRQHYGFLRASKSRLRELPGWKQWDLTASAVGNIDDHSYTAVFDVERRFGNRFSSYLHLEVPAGNKTSEYGRTPYSAATSVGVRFQL
jgi:hypothetical protein